MAALTEAQERVIRAEVGSSPATSVLEDLYAELQSTTAVALAVLRPRLADIVNAAGKGGATIPGVIGVQAPSQPTILAAQISRLEGQLAVETGEPDESGFGASTQFLVRPDRVR